MTLVAPIRPSSAPELPGRARELASRLSPASRVLPHEPLAARTTLRVGGPADLLVEAGSEADLAETLRFCAEAGLPWRVLGRGSNLLVRDGGVRGVVITLGRPAFSRIEPDGSRLRCGAGARLQAVAGEAKRLGLARLEFLEGIPGTVGGALRMNAGAHGSWVFGVVEQVRFCEADGTLRELPSASIPAVYRGCAFFAGRVAVAAVFAATAEAGQGIQRRMEEFAVRRRATQPREPSAGCIFKNPGPAPAGRLVDELGLKGTGVGGARVSGVHGNFIVNTGGATARDVLDLIEQVRGRVAARTGIQLETEVEIIGED